MEHSTENTVFSAANAEIRSALQIDIPPSRDVLRLARVISSERNVRIERIAQAISADPIIALEVLKRANSVAYLGGSHSVISLKAALLRVGSTTLLSVLDALGERKPLESSSVMDELEALRRVSLFIGHICRVVAIKTTPDLADRAYVTGLLSQLAFMLACCMHGERYVELTHSFRRSSVIYKLKQEFHFDTEKVLVEYLSSAGIPTDVVAAYDRQHSGAGRTAVQLRLLVQAAVEIAEAMALNRWDRYSDFAGLPSRSNLRLLRLSDLRYRDLHDTLTELLDQHRSGHGDEADKEERPAAVTTEGHEEQPAVEDSAHHQENTAPVFLIADESAVSEESLDIAPQGIEFLSRLKRLVSAASSVTSLLTEGLELLTNEGPFSRAAIVEIDETLSNASLVYTRGEGFAASKRVSISDPLCPFLLGQTRMQSFNTGILDEQLGPLGVTAFALSPIDVRHPNPVFLYADRGATEHVTLEARRIFRLAIGILNDALPRLSGSLPRGEHPSNAPS